MTRVTLVASLVAIVTIRTCLIAGFIFQVVHNASHILTRLTHIGTSRTLTAGLMAIGTQIPVVNFILTWWTLPYTFVSGDFLVKECSIVNSLTLSAMLGPSCCTQFTTDFALFAFWSDCVCEVAIGTWLSAAVGHIIEKQTESASIALNAIVWISDTAHTFTGTGLAFVFCVIDIDVLTVWTLSSANSFTNHFVVLCSVITRIAVVIRVTKAGCASSWAYFA